MLTLSKAQAAKAIAAGYDPNDVEEEVLDRFYGAGYSCGTPSHEEFSEAVDELLAELAPPVQAEPPVEDDDYWPPCRTEAEPWIIPN